MSKLMQRIGFQPELRRELELRDEAMAGDLVWSVSPSTVSTEPTDAAWSRNVIVELQNADGDTHTWFNDSITTGVSIADTSNAGNATIESTTLTLVDGRAVVAVSGSEADWLGGTAQVETITCTTAVTSAGTITLTVTAAGMDNSPKAVAFEVATSDDSVTKVAEKAVTALEADADVSGFFTIDNTAGAVALTAITPAANDATMAVVFADTDTTSVVFGESADTTAGVAKETDTLTVAEATILGYTVSAATSVETFED